LANSLEAFSSAFEVATKLKNLWGSDYKVVVLGHIQRGGSPTAKDRILATKLGAFAIDTLQKGQTCVMVGEVKGTLVTTPLPETWKNKKPLDPYLLHLNKLLEA